MFEFWLRTAGVQCQARWRVTGSDPGSEVTGILSVIAYKIYQNSPAKIIPVERTHSPPSYKSINTMIECGVFVVRKKRSKYLEKKPQINIWGSEGLILGPQKK